MSALSPVQQITAAGQQLTFNCPHDQMTNPAAMVVFNKSPYELTFQNELIPAWSIMPFGLAAILGGGTSVILSTLLAQGVSVPGAASVYVQWLAQGEDIPDQQAFIADAVASAILGTVVNTPGARVAGTVSSGGTVNLQATDRSLLIVLTSATAPSLTSVIGGTTGINWLLLANPNAVGSGGVLGAANEIVAAVPVYGIVDSSVTINFNASVGRQATVIALPDEDLLGGPNQALVTQQITPADIPVAATANNNTVTFLAAPAAGFINQFEYFVLTQASAVAVVGTIKGHTSGTVWATATFPAGLVTPLPVPGPINVTEQLDLISSAAANVTATGAYHVVPIIT